MLEVGPELPALLVMQKCVVRHPSWWAGHLPTTVSAGEQDHGGWDSKPSLEAATESCPPRELRVGVSHRAPPGVLEPASLIVASKLPQAPPGHHRPRLSQRKVSGKGGVSKSPVKSCALFLLPLQMTLSEISFARVVGLDTPPRFSLKECKMGSSRPFPWGLYLPHWKSGTTPCFSTQWRLFESNRNLPCQPSEGQLSHGYRSIREEAPGAWFRRAGGAASLTSWSR